MRTILSMAALAACTLSAAQAADYTVQASANSSNGGTGVPTIALAAGQAFTVTASVTDLWSAGALPRWSNADGLIGPLYATGFDESGQAYGTQIGADFGLLAQDGFAAPYGSLVGRVGGAWMLLGTAFNGTAPASGTLELFYWDANSGDNTDSILVSIAAVPEPASAAMLGAGLLVLAARRRRRR